MVGELVGGWAETGRTKERQTDQINLGLNGLNFFQALLSQLLKLCRLLRYYTLRFKYMKFYLFTDLYSTCYKKNCVWLVIGKKTL